MWSGPIARITKNSTNWPTANQAWRRLTSSCESGKILTTVCALTKPWDILLPRNSCSSGNANLKRQSVTNLLDEYMLFWQRSFFCSNYCCTFLASPLNCTIRAHGPADSRFWRFAQTRWSRQAFRQEKKASRQRNPRVEEDALVYYLSSQMGFITTF